MLLSFAVLTLAAACNRMSMDSRLLKISKTIDNSPEEALASLDSIDYDKLSEDNRHYYDFLSLKARDKAYIAHTSDSLILDLIEYYSTDKNSKLYPEIIYYGGRVYSDLGDYPTSLFYFQQAADRLPKDCENQNLRCNVISQTGRLLNTLRL